MADKFKVIRVDNFARETEPQVHVIGYLSEDQANKVCELLRSFRDGPDDPNWYTVVPQDKKLWRGMVDLVGDPPIFDVDAALNDILQAKHPDGTMDTKALRGILDKYANPS